MDRYQKVEKPRAETPIDENEIRITSQGRMRNYITYAMSLLQVRFLKPKLKFAWGLTRTEETWKFLLIVCMRILW